MAEMLRIDGSEAHRHAVGVEHRVAVSIYDVLEAFHGEHLRIFRCEAVAMSRRPLPQFPPCANESLRLCACRFSVSGVVLVVADVVADVVEESLCPGVDENGGVLRDVCQPSVGVHHYLSCRAGQSPDVLAEAFADGVSSDEDEAVGCGVVVRIGHSTHHFLDE